MKRTTILMMAAALATGGCRDMGLDENRPWEEARMAPPSDLVVAVTDAGEPPAPELIVEGQLWVPSGRPLAITGGQLLPIGSANGMTVHARSWDQAPYDELFTQLDRDPSEEPLSLDPDQPRWQPYLPVIGGGGPAAGGHGPNEPEAGGH